jgi:hypothetical protein
MNNPRRRQIDKALARIKALALISEAINILEEVRSEEEEALNNLPESMSERQRALGHFEEAIGDLANVEEWLESAKA